jgi:hypothetical protein
MCVSSASGKGGGVEVAGGEVEVAVAGGGVEVEVEGAGAGAGAAPPHAQRTQAIKTRERTRAAYVSAPDVTKSGRAVLAGGRSARSCGR